MDSNLPITDLFRDSAQLNRVIRAVQLGSGEDFVTSLDRVHDAADRAVNHGKPTLSHLLEQAAGGDASYLLRR